MLEWIISSSVLAAVLIAVRYLFRGKILPLIQYALWGILLIRLLIPVSFGSSPMSVNNLMQQADIHIDISEKESASQDLLSGEYTADIADRANTFTAQFNQTDLPRSDSVAGMQTTLPAPLTLGQILMILWLAGSACMLMWFLFCNIRYARHLKKDRRSINPEPICIGTFQDIHGSGFSQLPVYHSAAIETPCLFGIFHPAVYVTDEVCQNKTIFRHVLIHENVHYRHGDHVWAIIRGLCIAVHWFNPLVWWAASLSRRDCELACDESTLKWLGEGERENYGCTLVSVTSRHYPAILMTATSMSGKKSIIRERVEMIACNNRKSLVAVIATLLIVVAAAGCTFTGAAENIGEGRIREAFESQIRSDNDSGILAHYSAQNGFWVTEDGKEYRYQYTLTGRMNNAVMDTTFIVLSNQEKVTFEQCVRDIFSSNLDEHFKPEETIITAMYAGGAPEADIREQFLKWRFTVNKDGRWTDLQQEIDAVMTQAPAPQPEEGQYGIIPLPQEQQDRVEAALAAYYSGIADIASEKLIRQMSQNRVPMSEDEIYTEYEVETTFVDVSFEEGKTDPFTPGIIYDFDARVIVNGYELFPNYQYEPDEDGYVHMTGQITVDEGLVTKIYVSK